MESKGVHTAAASGNLIQLKKLLADGAPINPRDENGATPLFLAAFYGRQAAVEFLIGLGANVNEGNQVNYTPLMAAAREKHVEIVQVLLKAKADPELEAQGKKAVHWALLGTIPKQKGRPLETETRLIEILKTFKRYGANLNTKGKKGSTALMDSAWWSLVSVVEFLLQQGANPSDKDCDGQTAEDYAARKRDKNFAKDINERCEEIIQILRRKGQKSWWKFF